MKITRVQGEDSIHNCIKYREAEMIKDDRKGIAERDIILSR